MDLIQILLVEDNVGDVMLTRETFADSKIANQFHVVRDGVEALDYLYQRGAHKDAIRPDLILLDLNLPRMGGKDVLEEIKNDPKLAPIPVVVLTTSDAEIDIIRSYQLHANAYVTKPVDLDQFTEIVHSIEDFWFSIVKLPNDPRKLD